MTQAIERNRRKVRTGIVTSNAMNKSIVVRIDRKIKHPRYSRPVMRSASLYAHDEKNEANIGDTVRIMETRPLSKLKRWRLLEIVERAK
jgi:small subunit ribosomal protein S17